MSINPTCVLFIVNWYCMTSPLSKILLFVQLKFTFKILTIFCQADYLYCDYGCVLTMINPDWWVSRCGWKEPLSSSNTSCKSPIYKYLKDKVRQKSLSTLFHCRLQTKRHLQQPAVLQYQLSTTFSDINQDDILGPARFYHGMYLIALRYIQMIWNWNSLFSSFHVSISLKL